MAADDAPDPEAASAKDLASTECTPPETTVTAPQDDQEQTLEEGEISEDAEDSKTDTAKNMRPEDYKWLKIGCAVLEDGQPDHYFHNFVTLDMKWEAPEEPYWILDPNTNLYSYSLDKNLIKTAAQLQQSEVAAGDAQANDAQSSQSAATEEYQGYNPKIHGSYDPTAPYAQYHNRLRAEEAAQEARNNPTFTPQAQSYAAAGTFNRFTGAFQTGDKNTDRHNDYNKSGRQLNAFFDVEAAANANEGRSLKAERRQQKLSKQQVAEMNANRKAKKEAKRRAFLMS